MIPLVLVCSVQKAYPGDEIYIGLAWDKNEELDLDGYRIFCREKGLDYDYNAPAWEIHDPNCRSFNIKINDPNFRVFNVKIYDPNCTEFTIEGFNPTIYYFVARAFDTWDNESENSNEVRYPPLGDNGQGSSGCFIKDAVKPDP